jgi:DNA-binding SARP family transcriptional activator
VRYEGDRYRLDVPGATDFDARIFEDTITAALRAGRRGAYPVDQVRDALTLYRGDFLDGESIEDWHLELRDRLARLHADALESLGGALASAGRWQEAVEILESLVAREPLHERGYHDLMVARARGGDRDGAMRDYRRLVEVLRREGAAGPGREVAALYGRLQRGETLPS